MKQLGKIKSAKFGFGGYQDAMLGLTISLEFPKESTGVVAFLNGGWIIERSEHAQWTEQQRAEQQSKMCMQIIKIIQMAKCSSVDELIGKPVEVEFDGNVLKDWRILEEVL